MSNIHEKVLKRKWIYTTRINMSKERLKCPYHECKQECSWYWNLMRHIKRFHNGIGMPVKQKSTDNNAHLQPEIEETSASKVWQQLLSTILPCQ